ncbi:response regulator [Paenibacillus allorhizosphaerae]|uniref:Response regulatory protein n=1 Tax=Paenibacillus allorhizosphaerae TaxID=2849866 RepID=A0ABM8VRZ1_9BACL|nr:response regulator [Paenibacillus allorhizosphaerae]CAG7655899.1 putative response regulatory protein [Paenibacillus allorhizosphaerae]
MYRVLLVDDEKWVRTSLKKVLERTEMPFEVVKEAANGLEALDWLKSQAEPVDLVLTDVRMPVMCGLTFADQLKESGKASSVIVISGFDDFAYAQQALRAGVTDYLLKPVEVPELKECLDKWMQRRQNEEQEARALRSVGGPASGPRASQEGAELSAVEQVVAYIHNQLSGDITLTEAAARVHLNASYLSQLFKQQLGRTFVDYLVEARVTEAKRLLTTTSLRISEIADRVGYADVAYFSNTFKKWAGATPSEFRRLHARPDKGAQRPI